MQDKVTGRIIVKQETFKQEAEAKDGAFVAISKAEDYIRNKGYIIGSMCGDEPIGFSKVHGIVYIATWRNIPKDEYHKLSGIITVDNLDNTRDGYRDGHVTINYFKEV